MSAIHCRYEVPGDLRWDGELAKTFAEWAPYELGGLRPRIHGRAIEVAGTPAAPLAEAPEAIVARMIAGLVRGFRDVTEHPLESFEPEGVAFAGDPFETLTARGDIVDSAPGEFIYRGGFLRAMMALDRMFLDHAFSLGAIEEVYPTRVPTELLRRAGYLNSFPHHALFVSPVKFDAAAVADVRTGREGAEATGGVCADALAAPETTLAPTVCHHTFNARAGSETQPPEVVTALNACHRHEPALTRSLERLSTFRMREIVFYGDPDTVTAQLDACFDWFLGRLRAWRVPFRSTTANDPFFGTSSDSKRAFQTALALKREVRLHIPASGRWIAAASFNNHQASLVKAFEIEGEGDSPLASACAAFGYERMLYALFCAFGCDLADWPAELGGSRG